MISLHNIRKQYGKRPVLNVKEAAFPAGGISIIEGHNGAGKTTLLRIISGLEKPDQGTVSNPFKRTDMVMCLQHPYMFSGSVRDNVAYGLKARGLKPAKQEMDEWMESLGLAVLAEQSAKNLSAGETRRVSLARALAVKPKLLLLDEPFANVDPESRQHLLRAILALPGQGTTVLMVSHILEDRTLLSVNRVRLTNGHIVEHQYQKGA